MWATNTTKAVSLSGTWSQTLYMQHSANDAFPFYHTQYVHAHMPIDDTGLMDVGEIFKTNYYVEFEQGLSDEEKAKMKRFEIYRSNPYYGYLQYP